MNSNLGTDVFLNKYVNFEYYCKNDTLSCLTGYVYRVSPHIVYVKDVFSHCDRERRPHIITAKSRLIKRSLNDGKESSIFKFKRRLALKRLTIFEPKFLDKKYEHLFLPGTLVVDKFKLMFSKSPGNRIELDFKKYKSYRIEPVMFDYLFPAIHTVVSVTHSSVFIEGKHEILRDDFVYFFEEYNIQKCIEFYGEEKLSFTDLLPVVQTNFDNEEFYLLEISKNEDLILVARFHTFRKKVLFKRMTKTECRNVPKYHSFYTLEERYSQQLISQTKEKHESEISHTNIFKVMS